MALGDRPTAEREVSGPIGRSRQLWYVQGPKPPGRTFDRGHDGSEDAGGSAVAQGSVPGCCGSRRREAKESRWPVIGSGGYGRQHLRWRSPPWWWPCCRGRWLRPRREWPLSTRCRSIAVSDSTGEKPQSKIWEHAGSWWAVLPTTSAAPSSGTWLWKLAPNGSWSSELKLSSATDTQADAKAVGDVTHILLYGSSPELVSIQYNAGTGTYEPWSLRGSNTAIALPNSEIATIDIDSAGRLWLATENGTDLNVFYSDSPYSSFSGPVTLASGISGDDIGVVTAFGGNKVGVLWSNQNTERFGFRVHNDGADPTTWSADEVPASQSALNVGLGMADDHLNVAVASDGTMYAAVKTSYDTAGYPKIALLVRRPGGTWDDLYPIDEAGTRGIVLLNENENSVRVVYTSAEGYNNIVMKTSPTSSISFGGRQTLFTGGINDVTSTKENWSGKVLVLASSASSAQGGFIDVTAPANSPPVANDGNLSVDHDTAKNGTLHATDNDSDPLTFAIVDNGSKGTAEVTNASTGAFTYTPDPGETGSDSFTFKANDGTDDSNVATIDVTIAGPNLLVGHWRADEGSGTSLIDSSGSGNNATLFGSPTWVTGQVGQAISLNGTTQYATVPDDASLDITDAITIATWFKTSKTGTATQYLVKKGIISNTDGYELSLASSGLVFARFNQSATRANVYRMDSTTSYPLSGSAWMHAAVTYDGTTMRLYINGVLEDSTLGQRALRRTTSLWRSVPRVTASPSSKALWTTCACTGGRSARPRSTTSSRRLRATPHPSRAMGRCPSLRTWRQRAPWLRLMTRAIH